LRLTLMLCDSTGSSIRLIKSGFVFAQPAHRRRGINVSSFGTCILWSCDVSTAMHRLYTFLQSLRALIRNTLRFDFAYLRQVVRLGSSLLRDDNLALILVAHRRWLFAQFRQLIRILILFHRTYIAKSLRFSFLGPQIAHPSDLLFFPLTYLFFYISPAVGRISELQDFGGFFKVRNAVLVQCSL